MTTDELYKIAIATRTLEIQLFWQRSNYFMVLNTAIAVGFFSQRDPFSAVVLAVAGVTVCLFWYRVNLGGKFWQSRWEERAAVLEQRLAEEAGMDIALFSADEECIEADVRASLAKHRHRGLSRWLDGEVLKKPSVSAQMMLLSLWFVLFWGLLLGIRLWLT